MPWPITYTHPYTPYLLTVNTAAEYRIRAERRLGEILKGKERNKGKIGMGRPSLGGNSRELPKDDPPTLSDIGLTKKLSSRAQQVAEIPEEMC